MENGGAREEFEDFVGGVVSLDEVQRSESRGGFEHLMGRIARGRGSGRGTPSVLGGGLLVLGSAVLALMPSPGAIQDSDFWRVARSAGADVLALGNAAALPMLLAGALLLVAGAAAGYGQLGVEELAGGLGAVGLGASVLLWIGVVVLWVINLFVLLLIIAAYVIAAIFGMAILFGALAGLANS